MQDEKLLEAIQAISEAAGEEILDVYQRDAAIAVTHKSDDSPLTEADRRAHELIEARLTELTPDIPVLSEESESIPHATRAAWDRYWLVDPLDGTKEFIKRNGEFTVNIALIEEGVATLGVVHVPVQLTTYAGKVGLGAWKQVKGDEPVAIFSSRLATESPLIRVVASRSHRGEHIDALIDLLASNGAKVEVVSMGSSLKICLCAEGRADLYPRLAPTCEWDTAAAHAVLSAAGGSMTDAHFEPLRYNQKDSLLNPYFMGIADPNYPWASLLSPLKLPNGDPQ